MIKIKIPHGCSTKQLAEIIAEKWTPTDEIVVGSRKVRGKNFEGVVGTIETDTPQWIAEKFMDMRVSARRAA